MQSGGKPVRGASVLATAEGAYARTDSTGLFCLRELDGAVQRLQIVALGFGPVERYLPAHAETLVIELVPLRGLSGGGPATASAPRTPAEVFAAVPEFLTADDSLRFARSPKSEIERTLLRLHALLAVRAHADSISRAGAWREVAGAIRAVKPPAPKGDASARREAESVADWLQQAEAVAWGRAALLGDDPDAARRAREALARKRTARDPGFDAWRARLEALLPH